MNEKAWDVEDSVENEQRLKEAKTEDVKIENLLSEMQRVREQTAPIVGEMKSLQAERLEWDNKIFSVQELYKIRESGVTIAQRDGIVADALEKIAKIDQRLMNLNVPWSKLNDRAVEIQKRINAPTEEDKLVLRKKMKSRAREIALESYLKQNGKPVSREDITTVERGLCSSAVDQACKEYYYDINPEEKTHEGDNVRHWVSNRLEQMLPVNSWRSREPKKNRRPK